MIWLVKTHDNHRIKKITTYSLGFIVVSALLALFSLIIVSKYEAIAELLILVTIQVWTLLVVWHSRDEFKA